MRTGQLALFASSFAAVICHSGLARAQGDAPAAPASEAAAPASEAAAEGEADKAGEGEAGAEEDDGLGVSVGLGYSSMYYWRGRNLLAAEDDSHMTQAGMINPALSYTVGEFTLAYWAAFQTNGSAKDYNTDNALNHEHDLVFTVEHAVTEEFTVTPQMAFYYYPAADSEQVGARAPMYFEPSLALTYASVVDVKLFTAWYAGLQNALKDERYVYVNPSVAKSIEVNELLGVDLSLGYGLKLYTSDYEPDENRHDINFTAGLPLSFVDGLTVTPAFSVAWSDWKENGSVLAWGALNASYEF